MIRLSANVTVSGLTPDITAAEFNEVKRIAYREMGEKFWRENLPRRFTWSGARMLGFARRSERYTKKKGALKGHTDPLVWSGESKKLATTIKDIRSTATKNNTHVRIAIHARGLNRVHPSALARGIKPSEEVRRVGPREVPPLTRFLGIRIRAGFKNIPFNPKRDKVF